MAWRMERGGHGLPKVSPGPALPDPSKPGGWPAVVFYPLGHPTPYAYDEWSRSVRSHDIVRLGEKQQQQQQKLLQQQQDAKLIKDVYVSPTV
jgi:hypothetical protein